MISNVSSSGQIKFVENLQLIRYLFEDHRRQETHMITLQLILAYVN